MKILYYLTATICLVGWAVSVFGYSATDLIHSLLAFAVIFFTLGVMNDEEQPEPTPAPLPTRNYRT